MTFPTMVAPVYHLQTFESREIFNFSSLLHLKIMIKITVIISKIIQDYHQK